MERESGALAADHLSGGASHWCTSKTDVFSLKFRETAWNLSSVPSHHQDLLTGTNWNKVKTCTEENRMKSKLLENTLLCSRCPSRRFIFYISDSSLYLSTGVRRLSSGLPGGTNEKLTKPKIYVVFRWRTAPLIPSPANSLFMQHPPFFSMHSANLFIPAVPPDISCYWRLYRT